MKPGIGGTKIVRDEPGPYCANQQGSGHPDIKIRLLENRAQGLSRKLRKANGEWNVFE